MTTNGDEILEQAFADAVELEGNARDAFLAEFAERHPALADQLRKLVAADASSSGDLSSRISRSVQSLSLDDEDPWIGKPIGPYTIKDRIGAGGMGAVFLAERSDKSFDQTVAIKIMATQLLSSHAVSRFRTERQILASLNHPCIAKLVDGGSTETDLPYLVMEFIEGVAIDEYCKAHDLSIRDRIELFQKVCAAVDYAHRNLIVHRDLKPSNILVEKNGSPKLLDFGIAKLLDPDDFQLTVAQTGNADRLMTPDFASPEQIRGEKVSVATDIYALGVLLFRLLTGASPYGTSTVPREIENAILNDEPKSPSSALTSLTSSPATLELSPEKRAALLAKQKHLRKSIKGDLDNIVLKCMQKDPERRYISAHELSADLYRYLHNQPVRAHGDDWFYKTKKFAIRRARPLTAAAAVALFVVGLTTYYTIQLSTERNQALQAATEARRAATQSEEVSAFLQNLFESASPTVTQGQEITVIDLLDAGVDQIDQLSDQPVVQAKLLRIMGESYVHLGRPELSVKLSERSLSILESNPSVEPLELAEGLHELAEAKRLHGQLREAEAAMRRALEIRIQERGPDDLIVAETLGRLGTILFDTKDVEEGLALLRRAVEIKSRASREPDELLIDMRGNLAITLDTLGRYDEAEALMRENVVLSERISGEYFPNTIIRLSNLGLVQLRRARYEEGLATMSEVLRRAEITWPEAHPNRAIYHSVLGMTKLDLGDFDEAREYAEKAVEIAKAGTGEQHFRYVARIRTLATIMIERAEFDEADATLEKALSIAEMLSDEPTYQKQKVILHTGQSLNRQGRHAEAAPWLRSAIEFPDIVGHSNTLRGKMELGDSLSKLGEFDEAESLLLEVIAAHEAAEGPDNQILVPVLTRLAGHYRNKGDLDQAQAVVARAITIGETTLPEGHWHTALARAELAYLLRDAGDGAGARQTATRAHQELSQTLLSHDPRLATLRTLADG